MKTIERTSINAIRALSVDQIDQANSGHPGICLGAAPMAYTLFTRHLKINPNETTWFNRDRFVLSAGHGSAMLYSLLHLSGFNIKKSDLKKFRQLNSKTPGHPEYGHTPGVEATTGPLGQGIAMAVGMATAEKHLAAKYNQTKHKVVDHYTYAIVGDGDLMEGISYEAASFAGHNELGKLIVLHDSNDICLDGALSTATSEDIAKRFESQNWQVIKVENGDTDIDAIDKAIKEAKKNKKQPTLIEVKTTIGFGSCKAGTSASHGAPLGKEATADLKALLRYGYESFEAPVSVYKHFGDKIQGRGDKELDKWNKLMDSYKTNFPKEYKELKQAISGKLSANYDKDLPKYKKGQSVATRVASGDVLNGLAKGVNTLFGGSADLSSSTKTTLNDSKNFTTKTPQGQNIFYGVREFAMGAIVNGMQLHGGVRPFGGTFFVFSDYVKPAIRLAALQEIPSTFIFTHDSIAVGEDGPTHEPIEHLAMFRSMPNVNMIRPADANETIAAYKIAMESKTTPTVLALSRQDIPVYATSSCHAKVAKGAYVISKSSGKKLHAQLLATGSEVARAIQAQEILAKQNINVEVVSMPSWHLFETQTKRYQDSVINKGVPRVGIEMGSSLGWHKYATDVIAIDTFGASGPGDQVMDHFGFNAELIAKQVKTMIK